MISTAVTANTTPAAKWSSPLRTRAEGERRSAKAPLATRSKGGIEMYSSCSVVIGEAFKRLRRQPSGRLAERLPVGFGKGFPALDDLVHGLRIACDDVGGKAHVR